MNENHDERGRFAPKGFSLSQAFRETNSAGQHTHPFAKLMIAATQKAQQSQSEGWYQQQRDMHGVVPGSPTGVDTLSEAQLQELAAPFEPVREALRKTFGDHVTLYRAHDHEEVPNGLKKTILFSDKKDARRYLNSSANRKLMAARVPVNDIIATPLLESGYHEFVVRNRQTMITVSPRRGNWKRPTGWRERKLPG